MIKFQSGHSNSAKEINKNLKSGKPKEAERSTHTIKGLAGTLGAEQLQKTADALEKGIKERNSGHSQSLLKDFSISLYKTLDSLKGFEQEEVQGKTKEGNINRLLMIGPSNKKDI